MSGYSFISFFKYLIKINTLFYLFCLNKTRDVKHSVSSVHKSDHRSGISHDETESKTIKNRIQIEGRPNTLPRGWIWIKQKILSRKKSGYLRGEHNTHAHPLLLLSQNAKHMSLLKIHPQSQSVFTYSFLPRNILATWGAIAQTNTAPYALHNTQ